MAVKATNVQQALTQEDQGQMLAQMSAVRDMHEALATAPSSTKVAIPCIMHKPVQLL